jgi:Holliday junction resolvase
LIGRPSSPRWDIDIIAYKGAINEVLVVECKSYLDSRSVIFKRRFNNEVQQLMS